MRKHFFCAKNIQDYRKIITKFAAEDLKRTGGSLEDFEQHLFFEQEKIQLQVGDEYFDSPLAGETGIDGLYLDFNFGMRLDLPKGNFRVTISDADTGQIFFDKNISDGRLISVEKYFIRWHVDIARDGQPIFSHTLDLEGQKVLIMLNLINPLGDIISLLPFTREFKKYHRCELSICLPEYLRELAANLYPDIIQVDKPDFKTYATYYPAMFTSLLLNVPVDARNLPLERVGGTILGINSLPPKPIFKPTEPRQIAEPYVCIGVQASSNRKCWLWEGGWDIVVDYLKSLGYRVLCIDKNAQETDDGFTICKPKNAEDFTGNFSIMQRANMLYYAEFFIGLGSGLSWLANAINCPVVMICGFSQDWFEFYTPYRVANRLVCNGCFNDVRVKFIENLCPYHQGTDRELECQKKISPQQVINAIEQLILQQRS